MVSKAKLYAKLDSLEAELAENLLPYLRDAANGNNAFIFCVSTFNQCRELKGQTDKKMEGLIEIGSQILSLKDKLNESSDGSMAERICWYCRKWSDMPNHSKVSVSELAKQFLTEIEGK